MKVAYLMVFYFLTLGCNENIAKTKNTFLSDNKNDVNPSTYDSIQSLGVLDGEMTQLKSKVWANIVLSQQRMYLYENGIIVDTYKVTTGNKSHKTPLMDRQPSGPMYLKYTSRKYPGGDYMGLGNMPYAVFIKGGYAIHGATPGSFYLLGNTASHGCIRLHPTNAQFFFDLVSKYTLNETWITIKN